MKKNKSFELSMVKLDNLIGAPHPTLYSNNKIHRQKLSLPQFGNSFTIARKSDIPRVKSSSNFSRNTSFVNLGKPSTPLADIRGIPLQEFKNIYVSKCKDLGILPVAQLEKRYFTFLDKVLKDRTMNFTDNRLGPYSAESIGKALNKNPDFCKLKLSKNLLGDEGVRLLLLQLKKNKNIIHIDVSSNDIKAEGANYFLSGIKSHESIISIDISSHEGLYKNRLGVIGVAPIREMLQENPILMQLNLADTMLGPEGLKFVIEGLRVNKALEVLNLSRNLTGGKIINELLLAVAQSHLIELNISGNQLGIEGSEAVGEFLLTQAEKGSPLMKLDISSNQITCKGSNKIFVGLKTNPYLTNLSLECNPLTEQSGTWIMYCLEENMTLTSLNLSNCSLYESGIERISESLIKNKWLKTLYLSNNHIKDQGLIKLSEKLQENTGITTIDLSNNQLGHKGMEGFMDALKMNCSLTTISLKENPIKDPVGEKLVDLTRLKSNLQVLRLDGTLISVRFLTQISINLERNRAIARIEYTTKLKTMVSEMSKKDFTTEHIFKEIIVKQQTKVEIADRIHYHRKTVKEIEDETYMKFSELEEKSAGLVKIREERSEVLAGLEYDIAMELSKYKNIVSKLASQIEEIDASIDDSDNHSD